jgi:pentapeptide MXKDX repeat protein
MGSRRSFTGENVSNFDRQRHMGPLEGALNEFFGGGVTNAAACASKNKAASVAQKANSLEGITLMIIRTRVALIASAAVLSLGVALAPAAFAADDMKKDTMSKDSMSKDSMKKDSMSKDTMSKDSMSKDSMSKDSMKKDDGMKKN